MLYRADLGPESVVQISAVWSIIGAWLSAFPIPLDWDRDWQVGTYNICNTGTYCLGLKNKVVICDLSENTNLLFSPLFL